MTTIERIAISETLRQLRNQHKRQELYLHGMIHGDTIPDKLKTTDEERCQVDRMLFANRQNAEKDQVNEKT